MRLDRVRLAPSRALLLSRLNFQPLTKRSTATSSIINQDHHFGIMDEDVAADTCIVASDLPGLGASESSVPTTRRSTRARKPARVYEEESETASIAAPPSPRSAEHTPTPATRRNAKRKAAPEVFVTPENIIEASLQPWEENEQAEWPSWTELESDPVRSFPSLSRMMPCESQY